MNDFTAELKALSDKVKMAKCPDGQILSRILALLSEMDLSQLENTRKDLEEK